MTFPLTTHTRGYLSDHDLDVLRDYALEAPWEWRMALEELVDAAKQHYDSADLLERIDELQDSSTRSIETVRVALESFHKKFQAGKMKVGDIDEMTAGIRASLTGLENVIKGEEEPKAP